uniref:Uncharacterized protein n=1 Tax=Arundo donax TaxID=35708 RepID=A0A0A8Y8D9_ARUDO
MPSAACSALLTPQICMHALG